MNKYETTVIYRQYYKLGFWTMTETMDRIIDKWTESNGGQMNADELADMVDYIESIGWCRMAHLMHGYFWGAAIDNVYELNGEQLRNKRMNKINRRTKR